MLTAAHITTVAQFAEACKQLDSEGIYQLFEFDLSETVREAVYAVADNPDAAEPAREAFNAIGLQFNVQSLADY